VLAAGVGIGRNPPTFLTSGDKIEVEITGLGKLINTVADAKSGPPSCQPLLADVPSSNLPDASLLRMESGLHLHVEVANADASKTIIFVHGLGGSLTNYAPVIQASGLAESAYKVVSFDFEGHGLSPASGPATTVEGYAASIGEVLDAVKSQKAVVVGHSLGGVSLSRHIASALPGDPVLTLSALTSAHRDDLCCPASGAGREAR
jgi:pimeloyl-ACP methyl ester carboxylesterase